MTSRSLLAPLLAVAVSSASPICAAGEMSPHFEPLKPMLGKTWRGVLPQKQAGKPQIDVQRWELALNGQAVRILHSVNDGEYGGESLVVWDRDKQSLVFYYFTTAGFYTAGTAGFEAGALTTLETVKGEAEGITEVKGITRVQSDGRLHVKTQYLKAGQWVDARDMHYVEDKDAQVRFK